MGWALPFLVDRSAAQSVFAGRESGQQRSPMHFRQAHRPRERLSSHRVKALSARGYLSIGQGTPMLGWRVDRYDWYTKHGVVLGWSPIAGKMAVLAIRPQSSDSLDKQVELGSYLGGKHLKSWTTAQLQSLGAEVVVSKPGGRMAMFQVLGCEQHVSIDRWANHDT